MSSEQIISTKSEISDIARGQAVRRIWAGETLKFLFTPESDHRPVDRIIFESGAIAQQDLGLFISPLIHVWKPRPQG